MAKVLFGAMTELMVINSIFQKNSMQIVILNGITEDYFTTYKEHFKFIKEFYDKYNQIPSKETFQGRFADEFEWVTVTDPDEYLVDKLSEAKLYRDLVGHYKELGELIKSEKTDKAVEKMASISQQFLRQKQVKSIDLIDDANIRYEEYLERVNNPDQSFISTGLQELDEILGGWDCKNESAVICARTGFGKSWWLIYFALQAAKQGKRVGYYSGEMELDLVGYRLDTFFGNIPNGSLTHGNENVQEQYENYIQSLNKVIPGHIFCLTPDMCDGSVTVSKLRAFVEKYDLEMLCVDQFSLLDDEKHAKTPREQAINISKGLRSLQRLKKIPILSAVQLNREEAENGPTTRNISESDRIGQDCTTALFIERKQNDILQIIVGKARNAKTGDKLNYYWQINTGMLHYMPTEHDALGGAASENLVNSYNDSQKSDSVF